MLETQYSDGGFQTSRHHDPATATDRLCLYGELDFATVPAFTAALYSPPIHLAQTLVLDLTDLAFLDLHGMRAVLRARERSGPEARLVVGHSPARRLFLLTGNASLLDDSLPATGADTLAAWDDREVRIGVEGSG